MSRGEVDQSKKEEIIIGKKDTELFRGCVVEGTWNPVIVAYEKYSNFHKIKINKSRGTALHVAVNDGKEDVVVSLIGAIIKHERANVGGDQSALKSTNEQKDTPLHLAALRGFTGMCKCIIGEYGERNDLIKVKNDLGETPLFLAALTYQTQTFVYLHHVSGNINVPIRNEDGDSILHCAIRSEFLDLAIIITHCYPELIDMRTNDGVTPLQVLATRPSAFKSGSNFSWWKLVLYYCIPVEPALEPVKAMDSYLEKKDGSGGLERKEIDQSQISIQLLPELQTSIMSGKEENAAYSLVPPNCATCIRFAYGTLQFLCSTLGLSRLGISGIDINAIREIKQKHRWGNQLLTIFMKKPYESYMGQRGGDQPFMEDEGNEDEGMEDEGMEDEGMEDEDMGQPFLSRQQVAVFESLLEASTTQKPQQNDVAKNGIVEVGNNALPCATSDKKSADPGETAFLAAAKNGIVEVVNELQKIRNALPSDNIIKKSAAKIDPRETAFLAAAKNGIVEIVKELLTKIPNALHDTTSDRENVLLVAVKNRQPLVVELLRKKLDSDLFHSLILGVDNEENTVLHLAAGTPSNNKKTWKIAGAAMQMMWDIKWYQYIKGLVPAHFFFRNNKEEKTAGEIFKEKHEELVQHGAEWLKETSESCSVVAALIAGVSFATSSSVPGGNKEDTGKPTLEGQPAFDTFAIASLIGLFFSVTALIMFLSILTSRKQAKDFRKDQLPLKLLLGLSSLIVSITSMLVSFCAGHFLVLKDKYRHILFPVYLATCLPVTFYAVAQFPLYADLVKAIVTKVPHPSDKGDDL